MTMMREADYSRQPGWGIDELRAELERVSLADIASRNPGIVVDGVKAHRQLHGQSWTAKGDPVEYDSGDDADLARMDPLVGLLARAIDEHTSAHSGYLLDFSQRNALASHLAKRIAERSVAEHA